MTMIVALIAITSLLSVCHGASPSYRLECQAWDNVTSELNNNEHTTESCEKNIQCTGYDCSGIYKYQGVFSMDQRVELNYCFGVAIHPCKTPVNLHFYVDIAETHTQFQKNVNGSTNLQIPGLHYSVQGLSVDGFVHIDFERTSIRGHPYAKIGCTFKIHVQGGTGTGEWPLEMQRKLMPDTFVPIPPCDKDVVTPPHIPATCHKYSAPKTTTSKTPPTTTPAATYPNSKYMKPCDNFKAYECDANMMCFNKKCVCSLEFAFNRTENKCIPTSPEKTTVPIIAYPSAEVMISKNNKTPIIIGVSVTAIALVMAIIGVILFIKYRKHQLRYGNHQPLINNEEEDDDPIDVST